MEQEKLNEIIANHVKWLHRDGGERAKLAGTDLRGADLSRVNLQNAYLCEANLSGANLSGANLNGAYLYTADLSEANLHGADLNRANLTEAVLHMTDLSDANLSMAILRRADLEKADIRETNLWMADLEGAELPIGVYQIVGPGSRNRCTTYDTINDQIVCGCWDDKKGNHLDSFTLRVESIYGLNGEKPNSVYYTEYMAAITFFKAMKELKENRNR